MKKFFERLRIRQDRKLEINLKGILFACVIAVVVKNIIADFLDRHQFPTLFAGWPGPVNELQQELQDFTSSFLIVVLLFIALLVIRQFFPSKVKAYKHLIFFTCFLLALSMVPFIEVLIITSGFTTIPWDEDGNHNIYEKYQNLKVIVGLSLFGLIILIAVVREVIKGYQSEGIPGTNS